MTVDTTTRCGKTHAEHIADWRSWKDDCDECGFYVRDVDQCDRGHPDDGVDWCGACGFRRPAIDDLIEVSSLGTPEAKALRDLVPGETEIVEHEK